MSCNSDWSTRDAWVSGWVGSERIGLSISRYPPAEMLS